MTPAILRAGLTGWLVEVPDGGAARGLHRYLAGCRERGALPGVVDLVPGARTVLLDGDAGLPDRAALAALLARWDRGTDAPPEPGPLVTIPVRYDGPDLPGVAELTGLSTVDIVGALADAELTVAFCGFSPGFGYLTGLPEVLHVPRLPAPRTAVPAGAVAIAEGYAGVYPRRSPGGWRLVGATDARLWDLDRDPPALLVPGARVRFAAAG